MNVASHHVHFKLTQGICQTHVNKKSYIFKSGACIRLHQVTQTKDKGDMPKSYGEIQTFLQDGNTHSRASEARLVGGGGR